MKVIMQRHTYQDDLDWWRESAFRLGRERGCGWGSCETSAGGNDPKGTPEKLQ